MKYRPLKSIFQIRYDPKLSFYDKLYKNNKIAKLFQHWQTDRLKVTFKDFNKKHSLTIAHNNAFFESDSFDEKNEKEIISLLSSEIINFIEDGTFTRFGLRRYYLIKQEMQFQELVEIINLKCFSPDLKKMFNNDINDSSITIVSSIDDCEFNIMIGPMKKTEIPKFIKYNIDNHLDTEPTKRVDELKKIFDGYPEVSFFIDIDYYMEKTKMTQNQILDFYESSKKNNSLIVEQLVGNLFEEKLKK